MQPCVKPRTAALKRVQLSSEPQGDEDGCALTEHGHKAGQGALESRVTHRMTRRV
jgi:hypothetical protein